MIEQDNIINARRACIDLADAIEEHGKNPDCQGFKAVDPKEALSLAWKLIKTARQVIEDDDDRDDDIDRVAVLLDECEDVLTSKG